MNIKLNFWRITTVTLLLAILLVLFPFWVEFRISFNSLFGDYNLFNTTLSATLLISLISALLLVSFGFSGALLLSKIPFFSAIGKNLGILILPITLGNISIAFITKLVLGDSAFFSIIAQGSFTLKLVFLLILQLWQYGLFFVYLCWMQLQSIDSGKMNYAKAHHFNSYQLVKDIFLPNSRNLLILLGAIGFVFSLYEESKIAYLFKVSQGTDSELITNWLTRNYQTTLLVNPDFARQTVYDSSVVILITAIGGLFVLYLFIFYFINLLTKHKFYFHSSVLIHSGSRVMNFIGIIFSFILILSVIVAFVFTFLKIKISLDNFNPDLLFPIFMTFAASLVSGTVAILFGISSRMGWKKLLSFFNQKSLPFFVMLFLLMLIPPIVILITGYEWMASVGFNSLITIYAIWIAGHTLLTLPILGSFVLFNHFKVKNNEIDYLGVYMLNNMEIIRYSFLKRFKAEYLLLFIISFSFIWNEAVLNNLFSDYIPSFVSGLKMLITGRGADYDSAFGYLLVSFAVAFASAGIWRYIVEKAHEQSKKQI